MEFNQFQKELKRLEIPENYRYILTMMYEQIREQGQQLNTAAQLIHALTESVSGFVQLNEMQQNQLKQFMRGGRPDGVDVHTESVLDKPKTN